jgi:MSHA biogenesis protein MshE
LNNREGLILFTGPVGSGKSTFINATIKELADPGVKIVTVESPVELELNDTEQFKVDRRLTGMLSSIYKTSLQMRWWTYYISVSDLIDFETTHIALGNAAYSLMLWFCPQSMPMMQFLHYSILPRWE